MAEEALRILGCHTLEGHLQAEDGVNGGEGAVATHKCFDLGEGVLDRVEVWGVGRCADEVGAAPFQVVLQVGHALDAGVVHHHVIVHVRPRADVRPQHVVDEVLELPRRVVAPVV